MKRVIPRDLFNEAKLLKCMGQVALLIHDGCGWNLELEHDDSEFEGFQIEQNRVDGSLIVVNLALRLAGQEIGLSSRYNDKAPYPLMFSFLEQAPRRRPELYSGDVFTDKGNFTVEFIDLLDRLAKGQQQRG